MAANSTLIGEQGYDRAEEVKQFDESKLGVKGLVDSGLSSIPRIFIHPPETLQQLQSTTRPDAQPIPTPPSSTKSAARAATSVSSRSPTQPRHTVGGSRPYDRRRQGKINVGDVLQIISNEEYKSVDHRVLANPHHEARLSIAVLLNPSNREGVFGPLPELHGLAGEASSLQRVQVLGIPDR